jgi:hypothetical protein
MNCRANVPETGIYPQVIRKLPIDRYFGLQEDQLGHSTQYGSTSVLLGFQRKSKKIKNSNILRLVAVVLFSMIGASSVMANPHEPAITQFVDNAARVPLRGNVSSFAVAQNDLGAVDDSVPTGTLYLLLGRSSSEQQQLDQYVLSLSTPGSANHGKWITPAEFGSRFGANDNDISTLKSWLESQGFKVEKVSQSKTVIGFSGTMGAVRSAFGTEIHRFKVGGAIRLANNTDPQIPAALVPVVRGVVGLSRIAPAKQFAGSSSPTAKAAVKARPELTFNDGGGKFVLWAVAGDAAVIYDTPNTAMNPAYTGSTFDGNGVTIGAIEISNLPSASLQDFANYRMLFLGNTPTQAAAYIPTVIVEGTDPGLNTAAGVSDWNGDLFNEAQVAIGDGEISQALAPGSKTILYVAQTVDQALQRAVDDNTVSILINNMDECESAIGAAGNAFLNEEYEQAAAQGITVVADTGNWGSAGCMEIGTATGYGFGVAGNASSPWDTAVGGTDFQVLYNPANVPQYLDTAYSGNAYVAGTAPYYTTALSYIPEGVWNNTTTVFTNFSENANPSDYAAPASGGGPSSSAVCFGSISSTDGTCSGTLSGYAKPAYQSSLTPNDGVRDLPDIALFSGAAGFGNPAPYPEWRTCQDAVVNRIEADCTNSADPDTGTPYGGTTAAAAAAAGIFALVEQSAGSRLGLVNPTLYKMFTTTPSAFHDITTSNNSVPCTSGSPNCGSNGYLEGYNAGTGYDLASGLGSLDVAKLVANWGNAGLDKTAMTLTAGTSASSLATSAISVTHGSTIYFDATVNPSSATGNVAITNNSGDQNNGSLGPFVLSGGSASFTTQALPGGTYMVAASYGGDANDLPSESNSISITVTPESTTLGLALESFDPTTGTITNNPTSITYGQELGLTVTPSGSAGVGKESVPTGSVNVTNGSTSLDAQPLDATGKTFIVIANTTSLTPGSDSLSVQYAGDASYKPNTSNLGVTVTKGAVTVFTTGLPTCTKLKSDWSVAPTCAVTAQVQTDSVGAAPTGNISLSFNGNSQTIPLTAVQYTTTAGVNVAGGEATTTAIDVSSYVGTYLPTWSATYGGDSNYQGGSSTSTSVQANEWVVSEPAGATFALTNSGAITVSPGGSGTSTVTITPTGGFIGQAVLSCTVSGGTGSETPTCSIPSAAPTISSSTAQTVTLTIGSTAATAAVMKNDSIFVTGGTGLAAFGGFLLCGLLIRKRRLAAAVLILLISGPLLFTLSGCGGSGAGGSGSSGSSGTPGTPAGTYTVTVSASNPNVTYNNGWVSNPITATTTVTLTVN